MASTTLIIPLPSDGITTYQKVQIYRAPDSGGAPGAWALISTNTLDQYNENTIYTDTGGDTTSWYKYRYADTAVAMFSSDSPNIQAGQYTVKTWLKRDIPDADILDADWDQWRDMAIQEFRNKGIGRPIADPIIVTPSSSTVYFYDIPAAYRTLVRLDIYDAAGNYITVTPQWVQWGRKLRIFRPDTTLTYKAYGLGEIRDLTDIDDELFPLLYWYMRVKYLDKRIEERQNFRMFLNADKVSDVKTGELLDLKLKDAQAQLASRILEAQENWPLPAGTL